MMRRPETAPRRHATTAEYARLRELIIDHNLTVAEAARQLGRRQPTVWNWARQLGLTGIREGAVWEDGRVWGDA